MNRHWGLMLRCFFSRVTQTGEAHEYLSCKSDVEPEYGWIHEPHEPFLFPPEEHGFAFGMRLALADAAVKTGHSNSTGHLMCYRHC
jgi:hypothetical protein